jgi:hypothetical protein
VRQWQCGYAGDFVQKRRQLVGVCVAGAISDGRQRRAWAYLAVGIGGWVASDAAVYSAKRLRNGGMQTFSVGMQSTEHPDRSRAGWLTGRSLEHGALAVRLRNEL